MKKVFFALVALMGLMYHQTQAQMIIDTWSFSTGVDTTLWMDFGEDYMTLFAGSNGYQNYASSGLRDIGFPFTLGTTTHTKFSTNVNGTVRLGTTIPSSGYITEPLGQNINAGPRIDALGRAGMIDTSCYMRSAVLGDSGSRVLVVEARLREYADRSESEGHYVHFQVQLFEAGGLRVVYGQVDPGAIYGSSQNGVAATGNSSNKDVVFFDFASQRAVRFNGNCTLRNAAEVFPTKGRWYMIAPDPEVCPWPSTVTIPTNPDGGGVLLTRIAGDSNTMRVMIHAMDIDTVWEGTESTMVLPPVNPTTTYTLSLQTLCGSDTSYRTRDIDFFSGCGAVVRLPWETAFTTLSYSDCWDMPYVSGNNADFSRRWRNPQTGEIRCPGVSGTYNSWLKAPVFYLPDTNGITLKWDYKATASSGVSPHVELRVAPCDAEGTVVSDAEWVTVWTSDVEVASYTTYYANLDVWRGQRVRVAFVRTGEGGGTAYIDNVMLYQQQAPVFEWETPTVAHTGDTAIFSAAWLAGVDSNVTWIWHSALMDTTVVIADPTASTVPLVYTVAGWDTVTLIVSNVYGSDSAQAVVDVVDCSTIAAFPWMDDFTHSTDCWNIDGWTFQGSVSAYDFDGNNRYCSNVYYANNTGKYMLMQPVTVPATGAEHLSLWVEADGPLMVRVSPLVSLDTATYTDTLLIVPDVSNRKEIWWRTGSLAAYAGQTVRAGFFKMDGTQAFVSAVKIDYDTLPVLGTVSVANRSRTDSTNVCRAELRYGATDGLTFTWHSSLVDTTIVTTGSTVSIAPLAYTVGGWDTVTVVMSNAYGADTVVRVVQVMDCHPVLALPWREEFDDGLDCWYLTQNDTYHQWHKSLRSYIVNHIYHENHYAASQCNFSESSTTPADAWMVSRAVTLPADTALTVRLFWEVAISSGNNLTNNYRVMVSTAADCTDTTLFEELYHDTLPLPNQTNFAQRNVSLAAYAGQTVFIAFRNQPLVRRATALMIDKVEVRSTRQPRLDLAVNNDVFYYGDTATFVATLLEGDTAGLTYTWHSTLLDSTITLNSNLLTLNYTLSGVDTVTVIATNAYGSDTATVTINSIVITQPYITDFMAEEKAFFMEEDRSEVGDTVVYVITSNRCVTTGLTYSLHSTLLDTTVTVVTTADTCRIALAYPEAGYDTITALISNVYDVSDTAMLWLTVEDCPAVGVPFFEDFDHLGEVYEYTPCWPGYYWLESRGDSNLAARFAGVGSHYSLISPAIDLPADTLGLQLSWYTEFSSNATPNVPIRIMVSPTGSADIADFTDIIFDGSVPNYSYDTLSLDAYRGQRIRIAFTMTGYYNIFDDIRVDFDRSVPEVTIVAPQQAYTFDSLPISAQLITGSPQGESYSWHSTYGTVSGSGKDVTIYYSTPCTDTLTVIAANAYGSDTAVAIVEVADHPLPEIVSLTSVSGTAMGDTLTIEATLNNLSYNGLRYYWHSTLTGLTDSTGASLQLPCSVAGTDTVTFIVSNLYGADTATLVFTVFDCSTHALPYIEDFSGVTATASNVSGELPACWNYLWNGNNAAYAPHVVTTGGYQYISNIPDNALLFVAGSSTGYGSSAVALLPRFADSLQHLALALDYRFESSSRGTLAVGWFDSNEMFHTVKILTGHQGNYLRDTVLFADHVAANYRIALWWEYGSSWYAAVVDNIEVFVDNSIHAPTNLAVDSIDAHSARVTWTAVDSASAYHVWIDGVVDTTVSDLACNLTGLSPHTQYTVYVAAIVGTETGRSASVTFTTLCGAVPMPYYNNFSQGESSVECWTSSNLNQFYQSGYMIIWSGQLTKPSYQTTPIVAHPGNQMDVSFRAMKYGTSTMESGRLIVGVMTDPADTTTFIAIDTFMTISSGWNEYRFITHNLDTTPVAIAFCVGTGDGEFCDVAIDDLSIEVSIDCATLLTAEAVVQDARSVELSWQYDNYGRLDPEGVLIDLYDLTSGVNTAFVAHGTDTTLVFPFLYHSYHAELQVLCGSDTSEALSLDWAPDPCTAPEASASADTHSIVLSWQRLGSENLWVVEYRAVGSATWDTAGSTDSTSFTIAGLTQATHYEVRVGSLCIEGDTLYGNTLSVTTLCGRFGLPYSHDFSTGEAGCWFVPCGIISDATSYSSGGARMDDFMAQPRPIRSPEFDRDLNGLIVRYTVNGDRFFSSMIKVGVSDADGQNPLWLDSTIAAEGTHEYSYSFENFTGTQRHIIFYGDFITYLIRVQVDSVVSCQPVSNLEVTHLSDTAATLQWSPSVWPGQWAVYLDGVLLGTTNDTTFLLDGLQSQTDYVASVSQVCSASDTSVSRSLLFSTPCQPFTLPYSMDFENEYRLDSICWRTILYPYCSYPSASINGTSSRNLFIVAVSSGYNTENYDTSYRNFACSPLIDPQGQGVDISFRASLWSFDATSFFEVGIMADVADTAGFIPLGNVTPSSSSSTYINHQFSVAAATLPQPFCLAFRFGGTLIRCYIDDISITASIPVTHELTLSVNDTAMGTVSGAGTYEEGSNITFSAIPNEGYHFVVWSDSVTLATRTVKLETDTAFTAFFAPDSTPVIPDTVWYTVTVNRVCRDCNEEIPDDYVIGEGTYQEGATVTLEGHVGGCQISLDFWIDEVGDTIFDNPYSFVITSDRTLTAVFGSYGSIGEIENSKLKIEIYPNPASTDVTVHVSGPATLTVIDLQGRTVIPATPINSSFLIPHSSLPAGTYFIRVTSGKNSAVQKLIVK